MDKILILMTFIGISLYVVGMLCFLNEVEDVRESD